MLSDLALRSKGHWGYDAEFLEACRAELTVDPADIGQRRVTVAERAGAVIGFYGLDGDPPEVELAWLFVEPVHIGTGVGRLLLDHAATAAAEGGCGVLVIQSDPGAEGFYRAQGAEKLGESPSDSIPGRFLPLLRLQLPRPDA